MLPQTLIEQLRADTPGTQTVCHFNVAGAGLQSLSTINAINEHLLLEATVGAMEAAALVESKLINTRLLAAQLLNASPNEIYFQSSGSAAWGSAFAALPPWSRGDRILVSRQEWGSNVQMIQQKAAACQAVVEVMPYQADGTVDVTALSQIIDERVKLIALTWLPANGGLINDAVGVGAIARGANIPYFVDAGQAVGQLPVDVRALQCDVLKTACRKHLRGPRGTALLYVRAGFLPILSPAFTDVQAMAFEMHEQPIALLLGLHHALALARTLSVEKTWHQVQKMAATARTLLREVPGLTLCDIGGAQSGLISFVHQRYKPADLKAQLAQYKINIGANGVAYTPLDMTARKLDNIARVSISYLNTDDEINHLVRTLTQLA